MTKKKPSYGEIHPCMCSHEGCTASYPNYAYAAMLASKEGWFMQFTGEKWCPDHQPEWVAEWRAKKQK